MTFAVGLGEEVAWNQMLGGRGPSFGILTSYVMRICASIALSSLTAKNRPGLRDVVSFERRKFKIYDLPSVATSAEGDIFVAQGNHLVLQTFAFLFSFIGEPEAVKSIWVRVQILRYNLV